MENKRTIYYVSGNKMKQEDVSRFKDQMKFYCIESYNKEILEIQDSTIERIVVQKAKDAYKELHRPVLVENSGLILPNYGGLPGGLTQIMWNALTDNGKNPQKFSELFAPADSTPAVAVSVLAYCDGKQVQTFKGLVPGKIVKVPRGDHGFSWDSIFQPDGSTLTFAEMPDSEKRRCSMRTVTMREFIKAMDKINP
jgi:XTP/dITP diphosphohydrolase